MLRFSLLAIVICMPIEPLAATTIVSVTGSSSELSCLGCFSQISAAGWSSLSAYQDVSISAEVGASDGGEIFAYLVTRIGVSATSAAEVASTVIFPATLDETDTLFSGLTLPAATYFLVLTGPSATSQYWYSYDNPTVVGAAGTSDFAGGTANDFLGTPAGVYPPGSAFDYSSPLSLSIIVSGTAVNAVPEPSALLLGCVGLFLGWLRYRAGRAPSNFYTFSDLENQ
jgi:hypothetical protein